MFIRLTKLIDFLTIYNINSFGINFINNKLINNYMSKFLIKYFLNKL